MYLAWEFCYLWFYDGGGFIFFSFSFFSDELNDAPRVRSFTAHCRLCSDGFYDKSDPGSASAVHSLSAKPMVVNKGRAKLPKLTARAPHGHLLRRCGWLPRPTVRFWSRPSSTVIGRRRRSSAWSAAPLGPRARTLPACGRLRFRRIHEAGRARGSRSSLDSFFFDARLGDVSSHAIGPLAGSDGPRLKPSPCPHCPSCFIPTAEVRARLPRGSAVRWSKQPVREATHLSGGERAEKQPRTTPNRTATPRRPNRDSEQNREGKGGRRFTDLILNPANLIFRTCHTCMYVCIRADWLTRLGGFKMRVIKTPAENDSRCWMRGVSRQRLRSS